MFQKHASFVFDICMSKDVHHSFLYYSSGTKVNCFLYVCARGIVYEH